MSANKGAMEVTHMIRPVGNRVLIKISKSEERTSGGLIIPDIARERPNEGVVVSVGSGIRTKSGSVVPLDVKVGDRVLFEQYSGSELQIDGEEFIIVQEDYILAIK